MTNVIAGTNDVDSAFLMFECLCRNLGWLHLTRRGHSFHRLEIYFNDFGGNFGPEKMPGKWYIFQFSSCKGYVWGHQAVAKRSKFGTPKRLVNSYDGVAYPTSMM